MPYVTARTTADTALLWGRAVRYVCALLVVLVLAYQVPSIIAVSQMPNWNGYGANDYVLYMGATREWLATGTFYPQAQLDGPYIVRHGAILYPPVALWLFVPFTVLPLALWWLVPVAGTVAAIWRLRPRFAAWPFIALCLAWPTTPLKIWTGNPVIWCVLAMAVATAWRGAAPFALLKPSLAPFALFGVRDRSWWLGLAGFAALSVPFGGLWLDWLTTVLNARGGGLLYSVLEAPMLALPLVAWVGRTRAG
jgi:hypothetical protein